MSKLGKSSYLDAVESQSHPVLVVSGYTGPSQARATGNQDRDIRIWPYPAIAVGTAQGQRQVRSNLTWWSRPRLRIYTFQAF